MPEEAATDSVDQTAEVAVEPQPEVVMKSEPIVANTFEAYLHSQMGEDYPTQLFQLAVRRDDQGLHFLIQPAGKAGESADFTVKDNVSIIKA